MRHMHFYSIFLFSFCAALVACGKPPTPQEVTEQFWAAVENRNPDQVRKYVSAKDKDAIASLDDVLPISLLSLGKIVIDGPTAQVETRVSVEGDRPIDFPLNTFLVMEQQRWRVDYEKTIEAVSSASQLATVIDQVRQFGTALQEGIDRSVDELEKSLPKIEQELSRIEDEIKQQVPELRDKIQEFARQLEEAFKTPPAAPEEPPAEPGEPIEI